MIMNETPHFTFTPLSAAERLAVQRAVFLYVDSRPVHRLSFFHHWQTLTAGLATIILVAVGGISASAEQALPGDWLYPVKLHMNERLLAALQFGSEAEASFDTKLITRRLEEAEALAVLDGDYSKETSTISDSVTASASRVRSRAKTIEDAGDPNDAKAINTELEAVLNAHAEVFRHLEDNATSSATSSELIRKVLAAEASKARVARAEATNALKRVERDISRIARTAIGNADAGIEALGAVPETASSTLAASAQTKLDAAKKYLREAKQQLLRENYDDAVDAADSAVQEIRAAKILYGLAAELKPEPPASTATTTASTTTAVVDPAATSTIAESEKDYRISIASPNE